MCLGIMLSMHITKTIKSRTQCKHCDKVSDGEHKQSSNKDFSYEISMINRGHSPPIEGLTAYRIMVAPRNIIANVSS